ncbi:serine/arginine repetitive matrix protein 1, partial [Aspergillus brasiliensis]
MATSVDAKLLKQTKFPPEFSRKVDMTKVNIEVMKKWIAGKISEILGNEDDVVIELCFNLLEGSRFPDVKSLQIQLTGFLDKDTGKFCKELWSLCLSAQENPQGVPKELLEAKKLELIQEKVGYLADICVAGRMLTPSLSRSKRKELRRKPANRRNRSAHENENLKTFVAENGLSAQGEEEEAVAAVVETLRDVGRLRDNAAVTGFEVRRADESLTPTCPQALVEAVGHPARPAALVLAPCLPHAHPHHVGAILATTGTDDKRPTETEIRFFPQCITFTCPQRSTQEKRFFRVKVPFEVARARKSRDDRRLSRSRDRNDTRRRRYSSQSVSRSRSRGRTRSASQDSRSRSRSRSHSRMRDRKRRRSLERYAPVARRRRNTSSVSVPSDKRKRMADEDEDAAKRSPPPAEKPSSSDQEMKDATESAAPSNNPARVRISSSELREKLLREKIIAMRRTASSDK